MILLMVICDFNIMRIVGFPFKAYPPLVIDAYAVLAFPIVSQSFKSITWRYSQII